MSRLRLTWSIVVLVVAAAQLGAAWQGLLPAAVFTATVLVAYLCFPLTRWTRVVPGLVVFVLLAAVLVGAYLVARTPGRQPVEVLLDLVPRLLTAARPAPATPQLLVPGVLLVFAVSLVVAVSTARTGRSLVAPALGAALLYTAAALLTAGRADRYGLVAVALVVLLVFGWLVIDRAEATARAPWAPPAAVLSVLAAVALLAGVLPSTGAFEPRELVRPPVSDISVASPLPQLAYWAAIGDTELFRVRGPQRPMRLVALADFTGSAWRAASLYGPLGAVAEPDLPQGARQDSAEVEVTIRELRGTWLPTVGRPTSVSLADAMVDPDSGSLVVPGELGSGLKYETRGVIDTPEDAELAKAAVPAGRMVRRYTALPGVPSSLAEYARLSVATATTPYEQAVAIEQVVRTGRRPDVDAPVGSSYARLETFLFGQGESGANAGTAEQFASAFAVLGRAVGLPTRVVVGFQPVEADASGERIVRGRDATAWPEVYFSGWGWVPFDPVSGTGDGPSAASKREVLNRLASVTAQPTPTPTVPSVVPPPVAQPGVAAEQPVGADNRRWLGLLAVPALPLLVALVFGALRLGRRSRLRRAGATGAWAHVLDLLLLAGRSPSPSRVAPDVARDLGPGAQRLAALADRAAFAPTATPDPDAWRLAQEVRAGLRRVVPWYRRLLWPVDPRPLRRR
jgi:transglutaminase-like putative cysteine protease